MRLPEPLSVLIIDDNITAAQSLAALLGGEGVSARWVGNGVDGIEQIRRDRIDVAIVDLKMEPVNGIAVLRAARASPRPVEVIMVTAHGSVHTAVEAVRMGAYDFLVKPFDFEVLRARIAELGHFVKLRRAQEAEDPERAVDPGDAELVGVSAKMEEVRRQVRQLAQVSSTVLIRGETGTGKDLLARALHVWGPRATLPFVAVNCAAIPRELLESELFGHRRGSFSGAIDNRIGRFEAAAGGTLFLDEVGDLPMDLQVKLLRIIETRTYTPVGSNQEKRFSCRLVAATHRNLEADVERGTFRSDLFFRLNVIPVYIPALRDRAEDVPGLIASLGRRYALELDRRPPTFTRDAIAAACRHPWPGNVRELANLVERAVVMGRDTLLPEDPGPTRTGAETTAGVPVALNLTDHLHGEERRILRLVWEQAAGNQSEMARILGVERTALRYRLKKHGMI